MYEISLGLRFIKSGRDSGFINFISVLSTIGIALGVATLIIVLSVMNGFQKEVRDKMLAVLSHVEVLSRDFDESEINKISTFLGKRKDVVGIAPFSNAQSIVAGEDRVEGILVKGIDPDNEKNVSDVLNQIVEGDDSLLKANSFGLIIGFEFAKKMNVSVGDSIILMSAENASSIVGLVPRIKKFKIVAVFSSGHFQYDSNMVLAHKDDVKKFFRFSSINGLKIKLLNMHDAPKFSAEMQKIIPDYFYVRDWTHENKNWFAAVQIEKKMMTIILMLIIAVAAFNLVSMLVMTVTEKRSDIAILRTMGASKSSILFVFLILGGGLGFIGVSFGLILGISGALYIDEFVHFIEILFNFEVLPKGIYLIDSIPSDVRLSDIVSIGFISFALTIISTIYPSIKAVNLEPAQTLRYE